MYRFSTSRQTLTLIPDTFFTALLSGRISSLRDEKGAIFIDRDPKIFSVILNYLRTREIDLKGTDLRTLRHEAEYYNIAPLVKRLMLCEEMTQSTCGDVLFYGYLPPPSKFCNQNNKLYEVDVLVSAIPLQDPNLAPKLPESNSTTARSLATSNGGTTSNVTSTSSSNGNTASSSVMESACSNNGDCLPSSSGVVTQCPVPQNGAGTYVQSRNSGE